MLAVKNGQAAIVSLLLGARANPVRSSRQGSSAQKYAVSAISSSSKWSKGQARRRRRFDTVMEAGLLVAGHCASDCDDVEADGQQCLQAGRFSFVLPPGRVSAAQVQTLLKKSAKGCCRASFAGSPGPRCRSSPAAAASPGPARSRPARARFSFDTGIPLIERIAHRRRGNLAKNRPGGDATTHLQQRLETPKKRLAPGSDVSFDRSATPTGKKTPSFCMDIDESGPEDETPAKRAAMTSWRSDAPLTPQADHSPGRPHHWPSRSPSLEDLVLLLSPSRSEE